MEGRTLALVTDAGTPAISDPGQALVDAALGEAELSPAMLVKRSGISRSELYRCFAPIGGIARVIQQRRLRQANLFGPAGFVSADDGEVIEFSQQAFETRPDHRMLVELGGREAGDTDHMVTETLIRGMYEYWRKVMDT